MADDTRPSAQLGYSVNVSLHKIRPKPIPFKLSTENCWPLLRQYIRSPIQVGHINNLNSSSESRQLNGWSVSLVVIRLQVVHINNLCFSSESRYLYVQSVSLFIR